jgi:hypothetical protein
LRGFEPSHGGGFLKKTFPQLLFFCERKKTIQEEIKMKRKTTDVNYTAAWRRFLTGPLKIKTRNRQVFFSPTVK